MQRTCGAGHVYDADQFASCPYCNRNTRAIQFDVGGYTPTAAPGGFVPPSGPVDFGRTTAPSGVGQTAAPAGYNATVPPANGRDADIGETVMPDAVRRRVEQEKESKTIGEFKRKLGFEPVVGWLVCIEGPEVGKDYRLYGKINTIGRGEDNDVVLSSEHSVSQRNHVRLAYDPKHNHYQLIPGDGSNVAYLNDEPLYVPQPLNAYDILEMGETKLIFVPLCGEKFRWPTKKTGGAE